MMHPRRPRLPPPPLIADKSNELSASSEDQNFGHTGNKSRANLSPDNSRVVSRDITFPQVLGSPRIDGDPTNLSRTPLCVGHGAR